jgi:hypothetical protein
VRCRAPLLLLLPPLLLRSGIARRRQSVLLLLLLLRALHQPTLPRVDVVRAPPPRPRAAVPTGGPRHTCCADPANMLSVCF